VPGKRSAIPEFKERAARKVVDNSLPIAQVARELGVSGTTLAFWVKAYRQKLARRPPQDMPDQSGYASWSVGTASSRWRTRS
jgi:transposase-like protein